MKTELSFVAAALLALASGGAAAQAHTVYAGGAFIDVNSRAPALQGGAVLPPPGALIEVDDAETIGMGYTYRFAPNWSVEAALGIPPEHKTYGRGFLEPFGQLSTVKQVAPTVFLNYHFAPVMRLHPFVGLGLNFTRFEDARSTASGEAASGGPTKLELSDSWGLAAHVGLTYQIDKNWSVVSTIAYADVKSDLKATTTNREGTTVRTTRIDFRPTVYTLCVGYSF